MVSRGGKMIVPGILVNMASQVSLENDEFEQLIECPLQEPAYIALLIERGKLIAS